MLSSVKTTFLAASRLISTPAFNFILSRDDEVGCADVQIVAGLIAQELQEIARVVFAIVEHEADFTQTIKKLLVVFRHLMALRTLQPREQGIGDGTGNEIGILDRPHAVVLAIEFVGANRTGIQTDDGYG